MNNASPRLNLLLHNGKRYLLAFLIAAIGIGIRILLVPVVGQDRYPYITLLGAVVFCSWYCGVGPAIAATVTGFFFVWYEFLPQAHSFALTDVKLQFVGMVVFWIVASAIITLGEANRRARRQAQTGAERLRLSQQVARVGSFEWDMKANVNRWTPELETMYGLKPGTFGGTLEAWAKLVHPDDLDEAKRRLTAAIEKGTYEGEWRVIWPDGSTHWLLARGYVFKDSSGQPERMLGVNIDVSDRKVAERANNLLAAIVDSSDDIIISKTLEGVITSWNDSAERILGYTRDEAIGQHITLIIPENRYNEETEIINRIKRGEQVEHYETVRRRKDGTLVDLSLTISPVKDSWGNITGASKVARDISDRKKSELELRKSEEQLRALSNELEQMVHARTTELQQRNAEIVQQTEQLRVLSSRLLKAQDEERRRIARELHDSAGQLVVALGMSIAGLASHTSQDPAFTETLVDTQNLLQQLNSEIRTTSYLLHPPLLDETGLPNAIAWYMQGLKERSGLEINLDVSPDLGRLPANLELALFRILQECLTNVHRHSGSKTATIRLTRNPDSVSMQIQDYGKGISPDKLTAIRAQRAGVGVSGMRERVRDLDGVIDIHSDNQGVTVSVTFPLSSVASVNSRDIPQQDKAG